MKIVSIDVGRKNLAACLFVGGSTPAEDVILGWVVKACDPTPQGIARALRDLGWDCDTVVVERQPCRNPTMTRLQHYIEMFYAMTDTPVTVFDPKHKLSYAASTPWWPRDKVTNWTYHARKKLSVLTTANFLEGTTQTEDICRLFAGSKKKDDLADSFLQAAAFCRHSGKSTASKTKPAVTPQIKPRRPSVRQIETGKHTKANIAWFLKGCPDIPTVVSQNENLARSIDTQYGSLDKFLELHT